jgi:drug/metabolite transporter (DMT)-like permease
MVFLSGMHRSATDTSGLLPQILLMIAASLSFALMGVFVRLASGTHVIWKVFFRNLVVLLVILITVPPRRWPMLIGTPGQRGLLIARGLAGTLGVLGYFIGIQFLPLANASLLNRLNPFFVAAFGAIFLHQPIRWNQALAMALAFAGAIMVIEPGGTFPVWPTAAALSSAMFAGLAYAIIRRISDREDPRTVMAYFAVLSLASTLPLIAILAAPLVIAELPWLAGIGLFAAGGQALLTMAYRRGHAATVSAFGYSNVIFAAILGFLLYDERGSLWFFTGAGLIFISLLILYFIGRRTDGDGRNPRT